MSWQKFRLGELVDNFSIRAKDVGGAEGLDFFGVSNEDGIIKSKYSSEEKAEDYKIIEKDCFAYNPYRVNVGSIGLVADHIKGLISPAYVVFKPKPRSVIPELLLKFLKSSEGLRQIRFYARGTVRQALRFEDLCNIELSLPNYDEQIELFKILNYRQLESGKLSLLFIQQLDLIKLLRQSFLREAMQGKLVEQDSADEPASELLKKIKAEKEKLISEKKPKKEKELPPIKADEIPFAIPESWVWCGLGDLFNFIDYRGKTPTRTNEGVRLISAKNIRFGYIDDNPVEFISEKEYTKWMVRGFPRNGDILFVTEGHTIGYCAQINLDYTYVIAQRTICLQPYIYEYHLIVFYFIMSPIFQNLVKNNAVGAGVIGIKSAKLKEMLIPLPPLPEQRRIVAKLEELMGICDAMETSVKDSKEQNERLLQEVLREALMIG